MQLVTSPTLDLNDFPEHRRAHNRAYDLCARIRHWRRRSGMPSRFARSRWVIRAAILPSINATGSPRKEHNPR
jgi:hypothetical protein